MQLSILIPSHRTGLSACARILHACALASPQVEVLVRDNSGNAEKRALLRQIHREHCDIILAEPCDGVTNITELLALARGDFVYGLADDDFCFEHAVAALPKVIEQCTGDASVAGITGVYAIEADQGSALSEYKGVDSNDVVARVAGYLSNQGPNTLFYSPVRRETLLRVFSFVRSMPGPFSFHDQVTSLLYLLNGKFIQLKRLLYLYDYGLWAKPETAQQRDIDHYIGAGLDPAINVLHWFLCGFEGAVLARNSNLFPDLPSDVRQAVADLWFSTMFRRFRNLPPVHGSPFKAEAEALHAKLMTSTGQLSFQGMLTEICGLMALCSTAFAQRYFDFWLAAMNNRPANAPTATPVAYAGAPRSQHG